MMMRRLRLRDRTEFNWCTPEKRKSATGEITLAAPDALNTGSAVMLPNSGNESLELYGNHVSDTQRLYGPDCALSVGDWIYIGENPATFGRNADYRVLRIVKTPHGEICEIGKRGVFGG